MEEIDLAGPRFLRDGFTFWFEGCAALVGFCSPTRIGSSEVNTLELGGLAEVVVETPDPVWPGRSSDERRPTESIPWVPPSPPPSLLGGETTSVESLMPPNSLTTDVSEADFSVALTVGFAAEDSSPFLLLLRVFLGDFLVSLV